MTQVTDKARLDRGISRLIFLLLEHSQLTVEIILPILYFVQDPGRQFNSFYRPTNIVIKINLKMQTIIFKSP